MFPATNLRILLAPTWPAHPKVRWCCNLWIYSKNDAVRLDAGLEGFLAPANRIRRTKFSHETKCCLEFLKNNSWNLDLLYYNVVRRAEGRKRWLLTESAISICLHQAFPPVLGELCRVGDSKNRISCEGIRRGRGRRRAPAFLHLSWRNNTFCISIDSSFPLNWK